MGLKIAVTGKGGVGKSTLAALFAHLSVREGKRTLAVDADPDANLATSLGMPADVRSKIIPLSARRALIEERTGAKVKQYGQIFKLNPEVSDIAEAESALFCSIHLLVLGAIESGGSGCACPESILLRALMTDLILFKDDLVIIDFEAGLEHLGRGTARGVDIMAIVAEPTLRSVETVRKIRLMASEIGIRQFAVIGNKITSPEDEAFLENAFSEGDYIGGMPYCETIRTADRLNGLLIDHIDQELKETLCRLWNSLQIRAGMNHEIEGSNPPIRSC